mgnify:CR=1 FL=1
MGVIVRPGNGPQVTFRYQRTGGLCAGAGYQLARPATEVIRFPIGIYPHTIDANLLVDISRNNAGVIVVFLHALVNVFCGTVRQVKGPRHVFLQGLFIRVQGKKIAVESGYMASTPNLRFIQQYFNR